MTSVPVANAGLASAINNAISRIGQPLLSAVIFVVDLGRRSTRRVAAAVPGVRLDRPRAARARPAAQPAEPRTRHPSSWRRPRRRRSTRCAWRRSCAGCCCWAGRRRTGSETGARSTMRLTNSTKICASVFEGPLKALRLPGEPLEEQEVASEDDDSCCGTERQAGAHRDLGIVLDRIERESRRTLDDAARALAREYADDEQALKPPWSQTRKEIAQIVPALMLLPERNLFDDLIEKWKRAATMILLSSCARWATSTTSTRRTARTGSTSRASSATDWRIANLDP